MLGSDAKSLSLSFMEMMPKYGLGDIGAKMLYRNSLPNFK